MTHEKREGNAPEREGEPSLLDLLLLTETPAQKARREQKARFLELLEEEGHITQAAARLGVAPSTVYRWRVQDPEFNDAVSDWLSEGMEEVVATNMFRIATSTDPKIASASVKAGEFMLKSLNRDKYGDQIKQETTVTVNHQVQVIEGFREKQRAALNGIKTIDQE